jgi:hypothetical protein
MYDQQKQQELEAARRADQRKKARENLKKYSTGKNKGMAQDTLRDAKNLASAVTPWGALALMTQISIGDWMYFLALLAAILKDILDLIEFAGITYVIVIVITFLVSIFIGMMMLLGSFSHGQGRRQQKIIRSWLMLMTGTTAEMIFGINILPIETITVLIIWGFVLVARKEARQKQRSLAYA